MRTGIQKKKWLTGLALLIACWAQALDITVTSSPYNAVPDDGADDGAAFLSALNAIVDAGGGTLTVPGGDYHFTSRRTVNLKSANVTILGDGKGVSKLHSTNTTGIFWFSNTSNDNQLTIKDLTFFADRAGAGTAIQINNPSLSSDPAVCSLLMENVTFQVLDVYAHYFNKGIYTTYLQQPVFVDVIFGGPFGAGAPVTPATHGLRINYGNAPYFENCYSKCVDIGYELTNMKGDIIFDRCNAVETDRGFVISAITAQTCTVKIEDSHINSLLENINVVNADHVDLINNLPYCSAAATTFTDFILNNCNEVEITGCLFHAPYATNRTLIYLKGTTSNVLIKHNIFNPSGTRVQQDIGVTGVTVTQNIDNPTHAW